MHTAPRPSTAIDPSASTVARSPSSAERRDGPAGIAGGRVAEQHPALTVDCHEAVSGLLLVLVVAERHVTPLRDPADDAGASHDLLEVLVEDRCALVDAEPQPLVGTGAGSSR